MLQARIDIRVEWSHCDAAQIVYNPHFFSWSETGVTTLVKSEAAFQAPARFGEDLVLSTTILRLGRSSFDLVHRFTRGEAPVAEIAQVRVWSAVDPDDPARIRAVAIPDPVRVALQADRTVEVRTVWSD